MMEEDWMFHPPHGNWIKSMAHYIDHQMRWRTPVAKIFEDIKRCPPKNGWDEDHEQLIQTMLKIKKREFDL